MCNLAISRAPENLRPQISTDHTASARVPERDKQMLQLERIGTCKRRTLQLTNELGLRH